MMHKFITKRLISLLLSGLLLITLLPVTARAAGDHPELQSAIVTSAGDVELKFDMAMADPSAYIGAFRLRRNDGVVQPLTSVGLKSGDSTIIELISESKIKGGYVFDVSYNISGTPGAVQSGDGKILEPVSYYPITNNLPHPTITEGVLPDATLGASYSHNFNASGGSGPYSFYIYSGNLPAGLSLNSAGVLSGTPNTHSGTYIFRVSVVDTNSAIDIKQFSITVSPASTVCEISGTQYETLAAALAAVEDAQTITLLQDIPSASGIMVFGKTIELNLNGKTLSLSVSGQNGIEIQSGSALTICGGGQLDVNVTGAASHGLYVSGTLTIASPCTVSSANGIGVYAHSGDIIIQNASVTGHGIGASAVYGSIEITGNVAATGGLGSHGVSAYSGGQVEITGSISAGSIGVFVDGADSQINVIGDVTAGSIGAYAADSGEATIDGVITAATYIQVGTTTKTAADKTASTTKAGYHTYTDGISTVWVKDSAPPTGDAQWHYRSPLPTPNIMQNVKYLGGKYMAVGYNGTLITSDDGVMWQTVDLGTNIDLLSGIAYGNGRYVIVGYVDSYAARIYTSDDGQTWHETAAVPHHWLYDVVYGDDGFVAVGQSGKILISDDGEDWDVIPVDPMDYNLLSVTYAGGKYVASGTREHTGITQRGAIMTSDDGQNWRVTHSNQYNTLWDIAYGGGTFVAAGGTDTGSYYICTSTDGETWTQRSNFASSYAQLFSVDYDGSKFIAVGSTNSGGMSGPYKAFFTTSANGTSWADGYDTTKSSFRTVASNASGSRCVAMGGTGNIYTSDDGGESWTYRTLGATDNLRDIAWNGSDLYVAVGDGGMIQTSPDSETWTIQTSGTTQKLNKIDYLNGQFIAVGGNGTILTSTNGITWASQTSGTNVELQGIAFGGGAYVTGGNGAVRISTDNGISWAAPTGVIALKTVAYGNGGFVALSQYGEAYHSVDGQSWNSVGRLYQFSEYPTDMIYADGKFIAVGGYGKIFLSSNNGVSWTTVQSDLDDYLRSVAYGGGNIAAVAANGNIIASADGGTTWFLQPSGLSPNPYTSQEDDAQLYGIVTGDDCFTAVGGNGLVLQSEGFGISTDPDAHAVAYTKYELGFYDISGPGANENPGRIVMNMNLATSGDKGTSISWASSKPGYIAADGTVTCPSFGDGDQVVYLTATISKGSASDTKTFIVVVIESPNTDAQTVANAKAALTFSVIRAANTAENNIISNLDLVTTMGNGTTVSWVSSKPASITNGGVVTRPAQGAADETVTLTATITKGSASDTKTFDLVVKAQPDQDAQAVAAAKAALTFSVIRAGNTAESSIVSNLDLIITGANGTSISWASNKPACITTDGVVTRPAQGAADETVTLTATITKGSASDTKTFTVTVKAASPSTPPVSTGGPAPLPAASVIDSAGKVSSMITGTLDSSTGTVEVEVTSALLTDAFNQSTPDETGSKTIQVDIPEISGASVYASVLPASFLSSGDTSRAIEIKTALASVIVPGNMLSVGNASGAEAATLSVATGDKSRLDASIRDQIGNKPLIELKLMLDGKLLEWNNESAPVMVSIPYTPTAAELANPDAIVIWYIDGAGNTFCVQNGRYDPTAGMVTFSTTHFSFYAVGYNKVSFNDVAAEAWYSKPVCFIAARGISGGTGGGYFSPDAKLTRGQFIVMLMKAYGIEADVNPTNNFSDAGSTYYTNYLSAAKRLGISNGVGDNKFAPEKEVTRQEMFTLLYNMLKVIGTLPRGTKHSDESSGKTLADFTDASQIESWAKEALTVLTKGGIVTGSNGKLNPARTTTRAEMAQVLYNLLSKAD